MRAMQMAGAADRVLATAVEYSKQRVQFGRSISTFQAIQHMLAELASCVAATIASAEAAARDADEGGLLDGGRFSIAAAKSQASEFAQRIAAISHQSMGAMGFTHEHILHHYTRETLGVAPRLRQRDVLGGKDRPGLRQGRTRCAVGRAEREQVRGVGRAATASSAVLSPVGHSAGGFAFANIGRIQPSTPASGESQWGLLIRRTMRPSGRRRRPARSRD